ncbi:MAG: antibiotic biosynthesis monooxygenase [Ilumatobacteraceae bacterium]
MTFINTFDVQPDRHKELIEILTAGIEQVIRHRPGFISATVLVNFEGTRVVNLARWHSADDVKATQADPAAAEFARRSAEIATPNPAIYRAASESEVG